MNREEVKELLPIMQAFAEGKIVQFKKKDDNEWTDFLKGGIILSPCYDYRIKPEPKYRPFRTQEECWNEMHKHPDFGWFRRNINGAYVAIQEVGNYIDSVSFEDIFDTYTFTDGEPFGIKED